MTGALPWPISEAAQWMPFWKGAGFFLATFVLEDAAAIGAGLLLAAGAIGWPTAFFSCYLGIWTGDAGLYALARFAGRKWFERSAFKKHSVAVDRSEKWFGDNGTLILIFSRCVPGARLPTYLAAGFLRWPFPRFLLVTGLAALFWTAFVLWLTEQIGHPLLQWLAVYRQGSLACVGLVILILAAAQLIRWLARRIEPQNFYAALARYRHWEFWPGWLFYPPVAIYCLWLALKYRGLANPTVSNPGIFSGGLVGESKFATLKLLMATSPEFTAAAEFIPARGEAPDGSVLPPQDFSPATRPDWFSAPFILKPDLGQRGAGVKIIRSWAQAAEYFRRTAAPLVAQRYAPGPLEAGIFYYRFPHEQRGRIFSITEKIFPVVVGDGERTLRELIEADPRARIIAGKYFRRFAGQLQVVPAAGQAFKLVEAGNHAQGCIFRDGARLATPELTARIDEISRGLDGFFIGRYDVRYANEDDLRAGKNFQIVELNGAAAEATAIYDARNSLWTAYRTLFRQWDLVFAIGTENRRRGAQPVGVLAMWRHWRSYGKLAASYPDAD
jgi:membrane protein DedA with SNARE-associated domain